MESKDEISVGEYFILRDKAKDLKNKESGYVPVKVSPEPDKEKAHCIFELYRKRGFKL